MTTVHLVQWESHRQTGGDLRVVLENPRNRDTDDTLVAAGAAAGKLHLDTDDLMPLDITDCDEDGGRMPREPGTDYADPPTSRIIRFRWWEDRE